MIVWAASGLLVAGALGLILWPLLRSPRTAAALGSHDLEVYRDQLAELERDLDRGLIDADEAGAARAEIQRRVLSTGDAAERTAPPPAGRRRITAAALAILVPAAAGTIYFDHGAPKLPGQPFAEQQERRALTDQARQRDSAARIAELERRLENSPDDLAGWIEVARLYRGVERFADAARAFGRARELAGDIPIILSAYGEALTFAADGAVTPEAAEIFNQVLEAQPNDSRARYYLGLARSQIGDAQGALAFWLELEASAPSDAPWRAGLLGRMRALASESGIDLAALRKKKGLAAPMQPGPSREDMRAARDMSPKERDEMIRGMVARLAARLEDNPDDAEGWKQLGRSYQVLGERKKAAEAFARAESLGQRAPGKPARAAPGGATDQQEMIRGMVARLAARLAENPDDLAGWKQLGRSYLVLDEPANAVTAYARATELAPDDVSILTGYGEALINASGGGNKLPDAFVEVMRKVLALEPDNTLGLWYVGLAEARAGNSKIAGILWRSLLDRLPADAPERAQVEQRIEALPPTK